MNEVTGRLLRVVLFLLLLGAVLWQLLVPVIASDEAAIYPEVGWLALPYSVANILFIVCGQIALLAVWRLLDLRDDDAIFTHAALRWVDVIRLCGAVATVLSAGVWFHLLFVVGVGGPGALLALAACLVGGAAFVLLMGVMRSLLESAIAHRTELDGVI